MEAVVKDSRRAIWVLVIPCCAPIFAPLGALWMAIRLVQWYYLNAKYGDILRQLEASKSALVVDFRRAKYDLWFASVLWPAIIALMALLVLLASLFGGFERE